MNNKNFQDIKDIFKNKASQKKPPAYKWQELALRIIKELNIPPNKRSSVFKICKDKSEQLILKALIDTKELCDKGEKWQYFFKIININ
ncbi:hypothetical protein KAI92_02755 [Candidatus Parcubacteria bacterium]|nr:hypothetical protein [Candidatus Parcubacteria bacterium]